MESGNMKTLQNNFTTPEQSKRLLELGVPADSADCYLLRTITKGDTFIVEVLHDELYSKKDKFAKILEYLPCWSVGRLMEVFYICTLYELHKFSTRYWKVNTEELMRDYEVAAEENKLDFSKLEE